MKFAELFCDWLVELGYTHCYFVAGGAVMHLLDGARKRFACIPVVHEVAAGVAAEYHCEVSSARAFALVTAGPGVTNIMTGIANAWLESRELLVISGQVKRSDLADGGIRQRGIQEIDGRALAAPISVRSVRIDRPCTHADAVETVLAGRRGRPGPVFIEMCLDAQGATVQPDELNAERAQTWTGPASAEIRAAGSAVERIVSAIHGSSRPLLLVGGGVSRETAKAVAPALARTGIPVATTWNGADRVPSDAPHYAGRPNTWGQRAANIIVHQADCIVALGTRLGIQQTGFNWQSWAPHATVVQVEIDRAELEKGHPRISMPVCADANTVLRGVVAHDYPPYDEWQAYCREVRALLPSDEAGNVTAAGYLSPYRFYRELATVTRADDIIVPSSSGGANFTAMQCFDLRRGQMMVANKGLASMGIALEGAIGAAIAWPGRRTLLVDGDGGFLQNAQELATVRTNDLSIKIFIFSNEGYASIRTTQRTYFDGAYLGCDTRTGLGFPDWKTLFAAFSIPCIELDERGVHAPAAAAALDKQGPHAFLVPIDPEQRYYPKVTSRVTASGSMESNPLHWMTPELSEALVERVFRYVSP